MLTATTPDIKVFMNHFLTGTEFDQFLLCEATIMTGSTYIIDGHINRDFYDTDDEHRESNRIYQYWSECKPLAFQIVKGMRPPLSMKLILMAAPAQIEALFRQSNIPLSPEQVSGLYLNIRYEHDTLHLSSGTALTLFTMDRTLEHVWDETLIQFFRQQGISLLT